MTINKMITYHPSVSCSLIIVHIIYWQQRSQGIDFLMCVDYEQRPDVNIKQRITPRG